jgi:aspartyl aminopeptidase
MDAIAHGLRGADSSVLQQVLNRVDQAGQRMLTDDKHLFNIKIKILVSDDIAEPHGPFPVDMGITIL